MERRTEYMALLRTARTAVQRLELDLRGAVVAVEAGTKAFLATPLLALMAGADHVFTVTRDTSYGTRSSIHASLESLVESASLDRTRMTTIAGPGEVDRKLDVITNLAALRPVDERWLRHASPFAVVPYMCEAWELREGDVDLTACRARGVAVAGHDEDFDGMGVFESVGQLALKMCFEAGLAVRGDTIVVIGDRMGEVAARGLAANGAVVRMARATVGPSDMTGADAVFVADYTSNEVLLDERIGTFAAGLTVVQLAGRVATDELVAAGASVYPGTPLGPRRMSYTLAHLGPRPTINLLAQGLKVGELLWRAARFGSDLGRYHALIQEIVPRETASA